MGRYKGYFIQRNIAKTKPKVITSPMPSIRVVQVPTSRAAGAAGEARVRGRGGVAPTWLTG